MTDTKDALRERARIAAYLQDTACKLIVDAMQRNQYALPTAEIIATALEEAAYSILEGAHWSEHV